MFEGLLWIAGIVGAASGYIYQYNYRKPRETIGRKLARLPRSVIAELHEDQLVRFVGQVVSSGSTVTAPITGRACVHYHATVERRGFAGWTALVDEIDGVPFFIDDGTGRVYVEARRAMLTTEHLRYYSTSAPDEELDRFLKRNKINPRFKEGLRIREMRVGVGKTFTIMGAGVADVDPDAELREGYRADRPTRLAFVGGKNYPLVISDDPALR